jgi:hypothetical protein
LFSVIHDSAAGVDDAGSIGTGKFDVGPAFLVAGIVLLAAVAEHVFRLADALGPILLRAELRLHGVIEEILEWAQIGARREQQRHVILGAGVGVLGLVEVVEAHAPDRGHETAGRGIAVALVGGRATGVGPFGGPAAGVAVAIECHDFLD